MSLLDRIFPTDYVIESLWYNQVIMQRKVRRKILEWGDLFTLREELQYAQIDFPATFCNFDDLNNSFVVQNSNKTVHVYLKGNRKITVDDFNTQRTYNSEGLETTERRLRHGKSVIISYAGYGRKVEIIMKENEKEIKKLKITYPVALSYDGCEAEKLILSLGDDFDLDFSLAEEGILKKIAVHAEVKCQ